MASETAYGPNGDLIAMAAVVILDGVPAFSGAHFGFAPVITDGGAGNYTLTLADSNLCGPDDRCVIVTPTAEADVTTYATVVDAGNTINVLTFSDVPAAADREFQIAVWRVSVGVG